MLKRCLSILLVATILLSCLPIMAFAMVTDTPEILAEKSDGDSYSPENISSASLAEEESGEYDTGAIESVDAGVGEISKPGEDIQALNTPDPKKASSVDTTALFSDSDVMSATEDGGAASCGENLTWVFDDVSKTLTITGTGLMTNYSSASSVPWYTYMSTIEAVVISDGVTNIGDYAFCSAAALASVSIPDGVESVGKYAFYQCSALVEVALPNSITSLGYRCFASCTGLTRINIPYNWNSCPSYSSTVNADYCGHIFQDCINLTSVVVPDGMTALPSYAFAYCNELVSVTLPSTLTSLPNQAFYHCDALTSMKVPDGVTSIEKSAFCYCGALEDVEIPDSVTELALFAFYECKSLEEVQLPDSITSIGYQCFYNCTSLSSINIPKNWTETPSSSTSGTISTEYCGHIFQGCTNLKTLAIPEGCTIPSFGLCYSNYLETVILPSSATEIKNHTFYGCSRLVNIDIPDMVTYIGKSAFNSCDALEHINIPDGITEIVSYTFDGCEGLCEIDIPDSVTKIGAYAFNECKTLTSVVIPDSVTGIGYRAFANCVNLTDVTLSVNWNECISNSTSGTMSTSYCGGIFYGCFSLLTVTVPDGVTALPDYAFANCNKLKSVKLPNSLTAIPAYAFYGCSELALVQIPESVTTISKYAFYNCSSVQIVNIADTVQTVENYAFSNCNSSATVNYTGDSSSWSSIVFGQSGNSLLTDAVPNYNFSMDVTFGLIRPTSLGSCFYSSPTEVSYTNFYGFTGVYGSSKSNHGLIDVNDAFFGKNAYDTVVSIPRDSFITLRFSKIVYFQTDSILYLKTEGVVYEKADIYAVTESGELKFICTATEDSDDQLHKISLPDLGVGVTGLRLIGKDLDGASPGFDVVDLYLLAHETAVEADYHSNTTVSITRDNQSYNPLRETLSFTHGDDEAITLIVTPDWQNRSPGYIEVSQGGRTILKNMGGTFVDIQPGVIFSPLEKVYVTLFDADGNIVESLKLKLDITVPFSSRLAANTSQIALTIYENTEDSGSRSDKYVLSSGATITVDGNPYTTDQNGIVKIPAITNGSITVSKEGFVSRTLTVEQLEISKKIYLQQASNGKPVISAVWAGSTDVLSQSYAIDLLSKSTTTLSVEIHWGDSTYGSIALMQDERTVLFSGTVLSTVLSDDFDVSETIYIVATDAAGNTTKKALKFAPGEASAIPKVLDGAGFSISDKIRITLPDNIKPDFFAGQKINVEVSTIVPVTVSAEDGKVYVAIGLDLVKYESKDKWATSSSSGNPVLTRKTKTFIRKFKDTGVLNPSSLSSSWKKLKSLEQTYKRAIKYPQGSFGFEADFTILGFAEGYYDDQRNVTWLDGGVILNPSVSANTNLPFSLGPVPMYFEASLSADIKAQLNIIFNETAKNFTPNGEISGTITLSGGVAAGVKKVLYASGGVEGKLMSDWKIYVDRQDYFKLSASVNAYAKVGFLIWEYKHSWEPFYNEVWVEYPKSKSASAMTVLSAFYDVANYEVKDLSYLNQPSEFVANSNGGVALMSLLPNAGYLSFSEIKTNIYRESTPQFVSFSDGTALSVWLDSDNSNINGIMLYYSYFDGVNWSTPAPVQADGTMDYTPQLCVINDTAYLVWQDATRAFSDTDGLEDIAAYFDISVATFNATSGFEVTTLTNDGLDMIPVICGNANTLYVVWLNNGQNDWFGNNQANSILYSINDDTGWSEPIAAYSNLNAIDSLAADYNGALQIAYCMDGDGDVNTAEDVYVYENGARVADSIVAEANPQYVNHVLYWSSNGNILSREDGVQETAICAENYQIVSGPDGDVLIYTTSDGLASVLNASYYNHETKQWCEPYELMNGETFIGAFSAAMSQDGTLYVLFNSQEVTGGYTDDDPYGVASLAMVTLKPYCDLGMGELMYSADQYSAGDAMEISFDLTNSGSQTIRSAAITLSDDQGTVLSSITMDDVIVPGQTITASTYFNIDAAATGHNITITATPNDLTDINDTDNSQSAVLAFEDISVEQSSFARKADGTAVISANVVNYGYHTRSNIVVELRETSENGSLVDSATVASLDPLALDTVCFEMDTQNAGVYYIVIKESGDSLTANDADFVAAASTDSEPFAIIDSVTADRAQLYLSNEKAGTCIVAVYNSDGRMLTTGSLDVTANAGDITILYPAFTNSQYVIKVFFVDESYAPIYNCVAKGY